MLLRHILAAAFFCPILASAAIPIRPAQPLTPRIPGIAAGRQDDAVVASSGQETVVAWRDETSGREGVYVAALSPDGTLGGMQRWLFEQHVLSVAIAWTGQSYLIVWTSSSPFATLAMTVDGELRTLTPARTIHQSGSILSNLVWSGSRGAVMSGRTLLIVDDDGSVVAAIDNVLEQLSPFESARVAASGDAFVVIAHFREDTSLLFARRYTTNGEALDAHPVQIVEMPRISDDWDVAFGGNRFALVTTESRPHHEGFHVMSRHFIDAETLQLQALGPLTIGSSSGAHVEWTGDRFVAVWLDRNPESSSLRVKTSGSEPPADIYSARMLPFTESGDASIVIGPDRAGVAVNLEEAWNGTGLTVAHTHTNDGAGRDIYAETIDWQTGRTTRAAVAMSTQWQSLPAAAANGSTTLVAWTEGHPGTDRLRVEMTRVTAGQPGAPVVLLSESAYPFRPVVVSTDSMYLVFWVERDRVGPFPAIAMQRVSRAGTLLDATPTVLAHGFSLAAASNGTHVAVVWATTPFGGAEAMRLNADGRVVDTVPIALQGPNTGFPAIASNGTDFMVVWSEATGGDFPQAELFDVHAARLSDAGIPEPSFPVATGPEWQRTAAIASDGDDYVIVYVEAPESGRESVRTKKVLREGALADTTADAPGTLVATAEGRSGAPEIAGRNGGYFVTWEEIHGAFNADVRLASLDRDGALTEPVVIVAECDIGGTAPAVVAIGGPKAQLLYSTLEGDPVYGASMRLLLRRLGEAPAKQRSVRR